MSLHLTPEMLEAAYELLRTTPPFRRWKLPSADEIIFKVTASKVAVGECGFKGHAMKQPIIGISQVRVGSLVVLTEAMAHEMVHLHEDLHYTTNPNVQHSYNFSVLAKQVCRHHTFDAKSF